MMRRDFDYVVIGSGIAGLFFALKVVEADPASRIAIVTKKQEKDSSTNRAQGGIAAVLANTDSFDAHVADTLTAGAGLCHQDVVEAVVEAGPVVIEELIRYGVEFTRGSEGFDLGREGGHSANRVVHASDLTGREIERALIAACRSKAGAIEIFRNHIAVDLLTVKQGGDKRCVGAAVLADGKSEPDIFVATVTMLATGGMGQIYFHTSNPKIATGDGPAMAYRAGVAVGNLEFIQFHPTTLYSPGRKPFLISEAVRGEGAQLHSVAGVRFMEDAHPLKDLAPRDIVARAIDKELKESGEEYVLLNITHREPEFIQKRFPNIYARCLEYGFDITKRSVPVVPAAHYACGGVLADIHGQTSLRGLYCAGEVAMTGMHGANRLASNSLLEAVVMAEFAAREAVAFRRGSDRPDTVSEPPQTPVGKGVHAEGIFIAHNRRLLQRVMADFVGIVRTQERLQLAQNRIKDIKTDVDDFYHATPPTYYLIELRNMVLAAELVTRSAITRLESRGLHYLEEIPETKEAFHADTIIPGLTEYGEEQWHVHTK
jgi:L-aspartate oxidase